VYCEDKLGFGWIGLQYGAEFCDVVIYGSGCWEGVVSPDVLQDIVAGYGFALMFVEQLQNAKSLGR